MRNGCYKMCFAFLFLNIKSLSNLTKSEWNALFHSKLSSFIFTFWLALLKVMTHSRSWSSRGEQHFPHPHLSPCAFPVAEHRFLALLTRVCRCGAASQEPHSDQKSPGDVGGIPVHPACPTTLGCSVELCPTRLQQELYPSWAGGQWTPTVWGKWDPFVVPIWTPGALFVPQTSCDTTQQTGCLASQTQHPTHMRRKSCSKHKDGTRWAGFNGLL